MNLRSIIAGLALIIGIFFAGQVNAHPGNTASDGGHYCWTNCSFWGVPYGVRHFHNRPVTTPRPVTRWESWEAYDAHVKECNRILNPNYKKLEKIEKQVDADPNNHELRGKVAALSLAIAHNITLYGCGALDLFPPSTPRPAVLGASTTIPNYTVPAVVERLFFEVYERKITPSESIYWKNRARTDKKTETSLKGAMGYHKAKGINH